MLRGLNVNEKGGRVHEASPEELHGASAKRKDRGRLHGRRNALLSRGLLEVLRRRGQDIRQLRALENVMRKRLQSDDPLSELLFDRFWASNQQCILARQLELEIFNVQETEPGSNAGLPQLQKGFEPVLITDEIERPAYGTHLNADLLHRLALISRYERAASREVYRTLSLLLVLRGDGEDSGLRDWAAAMVGVKLNRQKDGHLGQ